MRDVVADHLVETQGARHAVDDGQHVGAETGLQLAVLVEVVQHDLGDGVATQGDDDAHAVAIGGLILDSTDALEFSLVDLFGDRRDQVVGVDLVRQLGDDEGGGALVLLDVDDASHTDAAAACRVGIADALAADNQCGRGEVGPLDGFHARREHGFLVGLGILQSPKDRVGNLIEVVRRDVGGHTDRDTARPVDQQVGDTCGQNRRLVGLAVVVGREIDCLLVDVAQHLHREGREACLGVTHGGRAIVAARTEVALTVDQRVPHRPRLREAHQRVVDRAVAVGMVVTHRLCNGFRGFHVTAVWAEPGVVGRVEKSTVHGLQSVAHLG